MRYSFYSILAAGSILLMSSCHGNGAKPAAGVADSTKAKDSTANAAKDASMLGKKIGTKGDISVYYFQGSPDYPDAELALNDPSKDEYPTGEKVSFDFGVKNYQLAEQTAGHDACDCNNSAKGQHIHLILNNKPYKALYKTKFDTALKAGHYVAVSFLSRSYHESVKNKNAFKVKQFSVGKKGKDVDLTKPMLVYSRPKGEYKGKDAENVLLDFYLLNTELSENGNRVVATINEKQFILTKWTGYAIKGLKMGKNNIKLELVDKDGEVIPGEFNTVKRTITIKE